MIEVVREETVFPSLVSDYYNAYKKIKSEPFYASQIEGKTCDDMDPTCVNTCCALDPKDLEIVSKPLIHNSRIIREDQISEYISQLSQCPKGRILREKVIGVETTYVYHTGYYGIFLSKLLIMAMFTPKYKEKKELLQELADILSYTIEAPIEKIRKHLSGEAEGMDKEDWAILIDQSIDKYVQCGFNYNGEFFKMLINTKGKKPIKRFDY